MQTKQVSVKKRSFNNANLGTFIYINKLSDNYFYFSSKIDHILLIINMLYFCSFWMRYS